MDFRPKTISSVAICKMEQSFQEQERLFLNLFKIFKFLIEHLSQGQVQSLMSYRLGCDEYLY